MVISLFFASPLLVLLTTVLIAVHGYRHSPIDEGTALLGYRFEDETNLHVKRDPGKNLMWIGPRLGRRKRSEDENNVNVNSPEKTGPVVEFLQDTPWAFVAVKGGKRRTVNFIPRLGRDSEEEYEGSFDLPYGKSSSRSGNQASPFGGGNNFTPRLGRFATFFDRERL